MDVKNQFISYSFITNINTKEVNKMASININNLSGFDLFNDSESFMRDLSEDELEIQQGGSILATAAIFSTLACMGGVIVVGAVGAAVYALS
jgi:predicted transcriptional regulator